MRLWPARQWLKRNAQTDEAGRFNFPQLLPGVYTVQASAPGFEPQQLQNVFAGLGQKQAVTLVLRVAEAKESVEVSSEASILNPSNANTADGCELPLAVHVVTENTSCFRHGRATDSVGCSCVVQFLERLANERSLF